MPPLIVSPTLLLPEQSHGDTAFGGPDAKNDLQRHLHVYVRGLQFPDEATHVALRALQRQVLHRLPVRVGGVVVHVGCIGCTCTRVVQYSCCALLVVQLPND